MFTQDERDRYQRQMILPQIGEEGQKRLRKARVLVVGAGGLGSPVLIYLAAAGIGQLGIIDGDTVDLSNLQRQVMYTSDSAGKEKVGEAKKAILALNPSINVEAYCENFTVRNAVGLLENYDLVIDGSDNFATRYLVNDACVTTGRPFIAGSVFQFEGQLSLFNHLYKGQYGPTYRCLFPQPPPAESVPNCAAIGVLGTVPGIIGMFQANEAIKLFLGVGELLAGRLFVIDILTLKTRIVSFKRNEKIVSETSLQSDEYYQSFNATACISSVAEMTPDELRRRLTTSSQEIVLVDVREDYERRANSIGGVHIPLAQLQERMNEIPLEKEVVMYCHSGKRSQRAADMVRAQFVEARVSSLQGGIVAWGMMKP